MKKQLLVVFLLASSCFAARSILPSADAVGDLGATNQRWNNIWAYNLAAVSTNYVTVSNVYALTNVTVVTNFVGILNGTNLTDGTVGTNKFNFVLYTNLWSLAYTWGDHATNSYTNQTVTNGLAPTSMVISITNGLAPTSMVISITNGLASIVYVDNATSLLVTASITNGLASVVYVDTATQSLVTAAITNGLAPTTAIAGMVTNGGGEYTITVTPSATTNSPVTQSELFASLALFGEETFFGTTNPHAQLVGALQFSESVVPSSWVQYFTNSGAAGSTQFVGSRATTNTYTVIPKGKYVHELYMKMGSAAHSAGYFTRIYAVTTNGVTSNLLGSASLDTVSGDTIHPYQSFTQVSSNWVFDAGRYLVADRFQVKVGAPATVLQIHGGTGTPTHLDTPILELAPADLTLWATYPAVTGITFTVSNAFSFTASTLTFSASTWAFTT